MSFKREGDDKSQLNILKKRRVADLLSNFIPEDEAALLKNGRYTCLVCSYRPVFDTVDTLTVHRNGKRHLQGLKAFYGKKAEVKNEITKRRQETFIRAEDGRQEAPGSAPLLERTRVLTHHALLKSRPYDSRHWRTSTKGPKARTGPISDPSRAAPAQEEAGRAAEGPSALSRTDEPSESQQAEQRPAVPQNSEPMTEQRRRELEHYLKLKSAGWVQDPSGNWTKDENVEFDSDEEEPSPLEPPLPRSAGSSDWSNKDYHAQDAVFNH